MHNVKKGVIMWSWSFFGYAAIFIVVMIILHQLWFIRHILIALLILGSLAYFITNYKLRNADMSDENVKKTTKSIIHKTRINMRKTTAFLEKMNTMTSAPEPNENVQPEPKPEPEGFVTPK